MSKSSTTADAIPSPRPDEILLLEFVEPMGLTQNGFAHAIGLTLNAEAADTRVHFHDRCSQPASHPACFVV